VITNKLTQFDLPTRLPELTQNVITSSHGHSTPSLKISCKLVQPFSRNVADKERKKERNKSPENNTPSPYRGRGNYYKLTKPSIWCREKMPVLSLHSCEANTVYRALWMFIYPKYYQQLHPQHITSNLLATLLDTPQKKKPLPLKGFAENLIISQMTLVTYNKQCTEDNHTEDYYFYSTQTRPSFTKQLQ